MPFVKTAIDGLLIFEPKVFEDTRGYFFESYNQNIFTAEGITIKFVQLFPISQQTHDLTNRNVYATVPVELIYFDSYSLQNIQ